MAQENVASSSHDLLARANSAGARGMSALADTLSRAGDYVEERASDLAEQMQWNLTREDLGAVIDPIERAAEYLRSQDPIGAAEDIDRAVHAHPWRSIAIAFGIGYLLSKL